MKIKHTFGLTVVLLMLSGCQSMKSQQLSAAVLPLANSTFETSGEGDSKKNALMDAMNNANITCKQRKNTNTVVINHSVKYKGLLDEKTDVLIDKVGTVIGAVSGTKLPSVTSKTDFEANLTFKCAQN